MSEGRYRFVVEVSSCYEIRLDEYNEEKAHKEAVEMFNEDVSAKRLQFSTNIIESEDSQTGDASIH